MPNPLILKVKYLSNYHPSWPKINWAHEGDSGFDLRACISETMVLQPMERRLIPNGIQLELDSDSPDYEIQIRPRSGLAFKYGIGCANCVATIDYNYRGEIKTILINWGTEDFVIQPGDRIAQAIVCPIAHPEIQLVQELTETERQQQGFGSSGIK